MRGDLDEVPDEHRGRRYQLAFAGDQRGVLARSAAATSSSASGSMSVAARNAARSARAACEYTPPASTATSEMIRAVSDTSSSAVPERAFAQSTSAGPWFSVRNTLPGCRSRWTTTDPDVT